jgi:hypothetical protein
VCHLVAIGYMGLDKDKGFGDGGCGGKGIWVSFRAMEN